MRRLTSVLLLLLFFLTIAAQPKYEVRAAWITTAYGLDWPHTRATDPQSIRKQKQELTEILDRLKIANFNTVLFQARTRGDVFYPSAIEPFSSLLTGKTGGNPAKKRVRHTVNQHSLREEKRKETDRREEHETIKNQRGN